MLSYLVAIGLLVLGCILFGLFRADVSEEKECRKSCDGCEESHRCGDLFSFYQPMTDWRKLVGGRRKS